MEDKKPVKNPDLIIKNHYKTMDKVIKSQYKIMDNMIKQENKKWLRLLSSSTNSVFRLLINDMVYQWERVSCSFMEEFWQDFKAGKNKGMLLERLEDKYGYGVFTGERTF